MRIQGIESQHPATGRRPARQRLLLAAVMVAGLALATTAQAAASVSVEGVNWDTGAANSTITSFRWTIEEDSTYHVVPGAADPNTLSVSFHPSYMPVVAQGDETNLAAVLGALDGTKHYYISVVPKVAGSWAIGGAQISPADIAGSRIVTVYMNKLPLPTAQISVFVFEDDEPTNGTPDQPAESPLTTECPGPHCMEGFTIVLEDAGGRYGISAGVEMTDAFGNPARHRVRVHGQQPTASTTGRTVRHRHRRPAHGDDDGDRLHRDRAGRLRLRQEPRARQVWDHGGASGRPRMAADLDDRGHQGHRRLGQGQRTELLPGVRPARDARLRRLRQADHRHRRA
jgi:hypothetical protein